MSILSITNLTHTFDGNVLFEKANLQVNGGEHGGIVGLNGAGKSTFMNILSGKIIQDDGEVKWLNGLKWGHLDQHADIDRSLTVYQYLQGAFRDLFEKNELLNQIYLSMEDADSEKLQQLIDRSANLLESLTAAGFFELESAIKKVANGLGIHHFGYDTKIEILSGGQRAKVMLAGLLLSKYDAILLDEPTNYLDIEHIKWLTDYLNAYKGTVLVISHDNDFLNAVSSCIISVEGRTIKKYSGNYNSFLAAREMSDKQRLEDYERQQQQIKKIETFIAKNKARAATAGMANARKKQLEKMELVSKPVTVYPSQFQFPYVEFHTKDALVAKKLEIGYYGKAILPPIDLHLGSETKLWIRGTNGIGKSTLLKTLAKRIPLVKGGFSFSPAAVRLYLEQDLEFFSPEECAADYIGRCFPRLSVREIRTRLGAVGIKNELALKPIGNLSGGEQVKVMLCKLCEAQSNFLLLDEPTNHLDINAKESLVNALNAYHGAMILVTHEKSFAEAVCNDVFDMQF